MKINHHKERQTSKLIVAGCVILFSFTSAYGQKTAAIEQALRDLDAQWSAAAGAKDLDKTVSYYAESAIVLPPNAPIATTKEAIQKVWGDLLGSPGLVVSWKTTRVEVARSGDIAYASGTYELTMNDASGKPVPDRGKYLEVWKKQAGGKWKTVADIWNSDLPAAAPATPEKK